jgi:hypothetical protein
MIRLFVVTAILFSLISAGLVAVKGRVQEMETRLVALQKGIQADRTTIRVLKAEWSHLNDPVRLKHLTDTHLTMVPVNPGQIASASALPFAEKDGSPLLAGQPPAARRPAAPEVASRRAEP